MKKTILLLLALLSIPLTPFKGGYSQFKDVVNPFRVVVVSPNYINAWPRFSTLQNSYLATRDSANAGKYFIINVVSAYANVSDWSTTWRDSILNKYPYLKLTAFGVAVTDSIVGVTTEEFQLVAGILSLNGATAGDGLSFVNHQYTVNSLAPVIVSNDTIRVIYSWPLYKNINSLAIKKALWSGLTFYSDSGLSVLARPPIWTVQDTTYLKLSYYFVQPSDSLKLDWNPNEFYLPYGVSPAVNLLLDSGLTTSAFGIRVKVDHSTIKYTATGGLTINPLVAGTGLSWVGDSLNLVPVAPLIVDAISKRLSLDYSLNQFSVNGSNKLIVLADSGLTTSDPLGFQPELAIRIKPDWLTLIFNASKQLIVNPLIAGAGLLMTSGVINIVGNEFVEVDADQIKVKTNGIWNFYCDSLKSSMTNGIGIAPFDSTGVPLVGGGKVKRIVMAYKISGGNDTTESMDQSLVFTVKGKIKIVWVNAFSKWSCQTWNASTKVWTSAFDIVPSATPASAPWRVSMEYYVECSQ